MVGKYNIRQLQSLDSEAVLFFDFIDKSNELSKKLTNDFGKGFDRTNLYHYLQFYKFYPNFVDSVSRQSMLSWTHYRILLQVFSKEARDWYEQEALTGSWSVRVLQRNASSDYYHRMLMSQKKDLVKEEMLEIVKPLQEKKLEFIKNPMVLEFLGITENNTFKENDLEKAIIDHLPIKRCFNY